MLRNTTHHITPHLITLNSIVHENENENSFVAEKLLTFHQMNVNMDMNCIGQNIRGLPLGDIRDITGTPQSLRSKDRTVERKSLKFVINYYILEYFLFNSILFSWGVML